MCLRAGEQAGPCWVTSRPWRAPPSPQTPAPDFCADQLLWWKCIIHKRNLCNREVFFNPDSPFCWPHWALFAVHGLPLFMVRGAPLCCNGGLLTAEISLLQSPSSRSPGLWEPPRQGIEPVSLHWHVGSYLPCHQGGPRRCLYIELWMPALSF